MNAASAPPLVFSWAPPRRRARALTFFLMGSIILHALCFYLFQITYPPTISLPPAPARLSVLTPDDPASLDLLRWVEAEDPALATTTQRAPDSRSVPFPDVAHIPSYATRQPKLQFLPDQPPDLRIPTSFPPALVQEPVGDRPPTPPVIPQKTSVVISDAPRELGAPKFTAPKWTTTRRDAPANAVFRIAVDANGIVRYCFLADGSGDADLDEEARRSLISTRFPQAPGEPALTWARATVLWGNDVLPPATPTPAVTP